MELTQKQLGLAPGQFIKSSESNSKRTLEAATKPSDEYFIRGMHSLTHKSRSDYGTCLRAWLKYFDKKQLLIVDYERIRTDAKSVLKEICDHIGAPSVCGVSDIALKEKVNEGIMNKIHMSEAVRNELDKISQGMVKDFNILLEEHGYDWRLSG